MLILLSNNDDVIKFKEYWSVSGLEEPDDEDAYRSLHYLTLDGLSFINSLLKFTCQARPKTQEILESGYLNNFEAIT